MKLTAKGIEILRSPLGVMLMIPASHNNELAKIDKDTTYSIEIKKKTKNRSLSANSYAWLLMEKIAKELSKDGTITTKEDIYKQAIKSVGSFTYIPIREDAVQRFIDIWQAKGLGWMAQEFEPCKSLKGYINVIAYNGSSTYLVGEMSRLINYLVDECNQLGITIESTAYINSLLKEWGDNNE